MKQQFILIFILLLFVYNCSAQSIKSTGKNENLLAKSLLLTGWQSAAELYDLSRDEMRNSLIKTISEKTAETETSLQKLNDYKLSYTALMYRFLHENKAKTELELQAMNERDIWNVIIDLNKENTELSKEELKKLNHAENLRLAYDWWLPQKYSHEIKVLQNGTSEKARFALRDNQNRGMDVLRIVKADESEFTYLGVYHNMVKENQFNLYLAGSNDLENWTNLTTLGERAHQGDIEKWGKGYLVANEQDEKEGFNNVQVRYYSNYDDLKNNKPSASVSIPRQFSMLFEGTPDIREITGDAPENSRIYIGFHYFENFRRDKQGFGVLNNFSDFRAWDDEIVNYNITTMGFKGNIGARAGFNLGEEEHLFLEAQIERKNWGSWRLLLGDGAFYTPLNLKTPKLGVAFANPGIAPIGNGEYCISSFLFETHDSESGEMLLKLKFE